VYLPDWQSVVYGIFCSSYYVELIKTLSSQAEGLILVQRGYYNNPVLAYFSTSHLLILIQTRISISWLWTIVSLVVDYCKMVVDYCNLVGLL